LILWKQYHNRANPQNSGSAGDNQIEKPIENEWDFSPCMDMSM